MSQTKVKSGLLNFPDQTDFVKLPSGTTAQRPSSPEEGYSRYNTTDDKLEYWNGTVWQQLPALDPPTLTSVDYPGNDLAADPAGGQTILINGTNFVSGISVEIGSTEVSSVTLNSTTQLAIISPALTAGDYDVTVTNLNATTITALDFISYNGVPSWVTASGSLGSLNFGETISTISLSATEPDGGNVSYAVTSGALPTGLTLSSSGDITGTMPSGSAETTYTFTVTATDDENQSTDRSFSITGVVPFVNNQNFTTVTYTGDGSTNRQINGVGFEPGLVWIKNRDRVSSHLLFDTNRGATKALISNETLSEQTYTDTLSAFGSDGFTVNQSSAVNQSGEDIVAWCWKAGGTPVSNTDGTITTQVSVNEDSGFSIIKYTGDGSASSTLGHGLTQAPELYITKEITSTGNDPSWGVYYTPLNYKLFLAATTAGVDGTNGGSNGIMGTNKVTSTTLGFSSGSISVNNINNSGSEYLVYAFHSTPGFSKIGHYNGNGTSKIVETGFEPAFVIIKSSSITGNWFMHDNKRNPDVYLRANTNQDESGAIGTDAVTFLKNGFSIDTSSDNWNQDNAEYIYMAFAENPNTQVPTKADSFNTVIYSGNNGTQTISGVGFETDLTITKTRVGAAYDHRVIDSVRGLKKDLYLNLTNIENHYSPDTYGYIQNISSTGYQVVDGTAGADAYNESGVDYVAWNWKAGVTPYINTDGSTTSVVSANPAAGFSIVSYTGNGNATTIGHGLNNTPDLIITKFRSATSSWSVYHSSLGANGRLTLDSTNAFAANTGAWNNTEPTSTVFSKGAGESDTGVTQIAYCFAEAAGFSKFGSYTGTGSSGNTVTLGFEPAFVMLKRTDFTGGWIIADNKRDTTNPITEFLSADTLQAEFTISNGVDFNANDFTIDSTNGSLNASGGTYIYMAFANQF